jgi:hemoglobin
VKSDIENRTHVKLLVDRFYERVKADELLAPVFAHVDWPHHLPIMYNFWSSVLFGDLTYSGNPVANHLHLKVGTKHFSRWLELFSATVDEHFEGYHANEAKNRAQSVANLLQYKMGLMEK